MRIIFVFGIGSTEWVVIVVLSILLFVAIRSLMLWYWKIDTIVTNQQRQIKLLQDLLQHFTDSSNKNNN